MARQPTRLELQVRPQVITETLYVGVDIGKRAHVAGFLSSSLLSRHQRFEHCPALSFENSREGFRSLIERIETFVPLTQVQVLLARDWPLPSSPEAVSAGSRYPRLHDPCSEAARRIAENGQA